jgi:hypothetical protein
VAAAKAQFLAPRGLSHRRAKEGVGGLLAGKLRMLGDERHHLRHEGVQFLPLLGVERDGEAAEPGHHDAAFLADLARQGTIALLSLERIILRLEAGDDGEKLMLLRLGLKNSHCRSPNWPDNPGDHGNMIADCGGNMAAFMQFPHTSHAP